jgi:hypothetical protein
VHESLAVKLAEPWRPAKESELKVCTQTKSVCTLINTSERKEMLYQMKTKKNIYWYVLGAY